MGTFSDLTKNRRDQIQANLEANGVAGVTLYWDDDRIGARGTLDGKPWELSYPADDENGALYSILRHSANAFPHPSKLNGGLALEAHQRAIELQRGHARKSLEAIGCSAIEFFEENKDGRVFGVRAQLEGQPVEYSVRADNEVFALVHLVRAARQVEAEHQRRKAATKP